MEKTKLKGFTLIEMLIVIVIIGILAVVLTESYLTISRVALRVEQQKNLSEESLVLTQIFQAISDEATIDYDKYNNEGINLASVGGFVDKLYLTGGIWSGTSIYTSGNCLELDKVLGDDDKTIHDYTGCTLILDQNGATTTLTSQGKAVISENMFRIIPYNSDEYYFEDVGSTNVINNLHQPAFWMFIHLYSPMYQPEGTNKVDQPLQLFFNLKL